MLSEAISRRLGQAQKISYIRALFNRRLIQKFPHLTRKTMSNASVTYPLELLYPAESATLCFAVAKEVGEKDLVATVKCFDSGGSLIDNLGSLPFSSVLSRQYVYLRPKKDTDADWIKASISAERPIKRIVVEIVRWRKSFEHSIEDVVSGVWAGEMRDTEEIKNPVNFVAIRGTE